MSLHVQMSSNTALSRQQLAACGRSTRIRSVDVRCSAAQFKIPEGARIKVVKPVKVYHVPKQTAGYDLQGLEGTVVQHIAVYKGKVLSANLPYKVQFVNDNGTPAKFFAHLEEDEVETI